MKKNMLLENLSREMSKELPTRRYSLADMISESYKVLYQCEEGTNLKKLAESHLEDVRSNPRDIDRLSRHLSLMKELVKMEESNQLNDEDLVNEKEFDTVAPKEERVIQKCECNESAGDEILHKIENIIAEIVDESGKEYGIPDGGFVSAENLTPTLNPEYKGLWVDFQSSLDARKVSKRVSEIPGVKSMSMGNTGESGIWDGDNFSVIFYVTKIEENKVENSNKVNESIDEAADTPGREYHVFKYSVDIAIHTTEDSYEFQQRLDNILENEAMQSGMFGVLDSDVEDMDHAYTDEDVLEMIPAGLSESKKMRESCSSEESLEESDDSDFTNEELEELAKYLETMRKERKGAPKTEMKESEEPKRRGIKCHLADAKNPKKEINEESAPEQWVVQYGVDILYTEGQEDVENRIEFALEKAGLNVVGCQPTDATWTKEEYSKMIGYMVGESKEINESSEEHKVKVDIYVDDEFYKTKEFDDMKTAQKWADQFNYDSDFGEVASNPYIDESKNYAGLQNFKKQSESKAFYKTFKKMHKSLKEGKALTRQESIDLYKAANSALTQMSIELEHNPKFLKTFKESTDLLSADVNSLRESLSRGKAPSKNTMKSLAKFSEALLCEVSEEVLTSRALDYMYGEDRTEKDNEYSEEEKEKAINYYLKKTEPAPKLHESEDDVEDKMNESGDNAGDWESFKKSDDYREAYGEWVQYMRDEGHRGPFSEDEFEPTTICDDAYNRWRKDSRVNESEDDDDDFVGDDEGSVQSEEADAFDQEYADARVELHKELANEYADDPDVQEKLAQDAEEVVNLPGTTEEQAAEINGEESEGVSDGEGGESPEEESDEEITDDELEELKKHLAEMRALRK